jgi:hypothetical protein
MKAQLMALDTSFFTNYIRDLSYKHFTSVTYDCSKINRLRTDVIKYFWGDLRMGQLTRVFVPGRPFLPCLIFWVTPKAYPIREAPEMSSNRVGFSLSRKHQTRLERLADLPWINTVVYIAHILITALQKIDNVGL